MKVKAEDLKTALLGIESDRQLTPEIVEGALVEAMSKAYRKHVDIPDAYVRVELGDYIHIYPEKMVVEEVEDDALEMDLAEAQKINKDVKVGDMISLPEVDFTQFDRAEVVLAKNVIKQKIREAEKQIIYEAYADRIGDMVTGTVETVEEKYTLVNIGKTLAMMKKSQQIPFETYHEGQHLPVIIDEVHKETKGAQVLVSRSTPVFVRRLFEKEVPEIYQGTIEIKAIAREAGERSKIAVYSHNENIDPIGACIGPRGSRVQTIINELAGEKIDIFEWSDNISTLIQNALAPSESIAVFPNDEVEGGLIVVVPDGQLSLAIGKKGKNARLAVRLTGRKIDIKSESEMIEKGVDYLGLSQAMEQEYLEQKAQERAYKQQQRIDELKNETTEPTDYSDLDEIEFTYADEVEPAEPAKPSASAHSLFDQEQEKKEQEEMEEAARIAKEKRKKERAKEVKEYTSKFENFADASTKSDEVSAKPKKAEEVKEEVKAQQEQQEEKTQFEQMKPIYSDEELAEIEAQEEDEMERWDEDVDYEEYDEYYD
ncbi:MAG: transcription termination/antitermination protein NusA [Erysipelotrichaceae bacterium]|nr:transcription termination/antitermination protein NusA [Erysipelotrichaceae bacterium]